MREIITVCPNCGDTSGTIILKCKKCGKVYCYACPQTAKRGWGQSSQCPVCGATDYKQVRYRDEM